MELVVIRHALPIQRVTEDGAPADPPLSEVGQRQAQLLARWLIDEHFDAVYSSPLLRALQTSEPLANAKGLEVAVHPGVAELDQDSNSYIPLEDLKRTDYQLWRQMMEEKRFGDGDPFAFRETVAEAMSEIAARHRGKRVAVVCHGGVINAWASHILGLDDVYFFDPTYTSINRFMVASTGQKSIVSLNEAAHLRGLE
ncbi:MAG: histidine phosphatase family protein [Dehalococcoidia bacterium]